MTSDKLWTKEQGLNTIELCRESGRLVLRTLTVDDIFQRPVSYDICSVELTDNDRLALIAALNSTS